MTYELTLHTDRSCYIIKDFHFSLERFKIISGDWWWFDCGYSILPIEICAQLRGVNDQVDS